MSRSSNSPALLIRSPMRWTSGRLRSHWLFGFFCFGARRLDLPSRQPPGDSIYLVRPNRQELNDNRRHGVVFRAEVLPRMRSALSLAAQTCRRKRAIHPALDLVRGSTTRFTFTPSEDVCPVWSPDGSSIVFSSDRSGRASLYQKSATGTGTEELLLQTGTELYADHWSSDGKYLLYESNDPNTRFDLWVLPMKGERKPFPFIQTEFNETHSQFSPNGQLVAYVSDAVRTRRSIRTALWWFGRQVANLATGGGDQPEWRDKMARSFSMCRQTSGSSQFL